ncbi:hypothetical protein GCM10023206_06940 [Acinetobacter puyangensis]|uniref:Uncharacterized protein n=1 Tax=Acinetobacter puyangensis TaxID=1096779 RepID=A0A240E6M4_9GAMM|nr:hypothetical protein [Acinetobacter puyangensis]SNX44226.1 hypothetical protein SAMN05421731_102387 [Acinetobacter puyangensis]
MTENTETLNDPVATSTLSDENLTGQPEDKADESSNDAATNGSDSLVVADETNQSEDTSPSNSTTAEAANSIDMKAVSAEKTTTKRKYTKKETSKTTTDKTALTTSKPTENIVEVVPQDEIKQDTTVTKSSDLSIKVTNSGSMTVVEPMTCTSIKPGETVTIEANSRTYYDQIRKNLAQLQAFGRKLEF